MDHECLLGFVVAVLHHPVADEHHPVADVKHLVAEVNHPVAEVNHPTAEVHHPVDGVFVGEVHIGETATPGGRWVETQL